MSNALRRGRIARPVPVLAALLGLGLIPATSQAIVIDFQTATSSVDVGDTFSVDVVVSDLTAAGEFVQAFDLFIGFDSSVLSVTSVALGASAAETFVSDTLSGFGTAFELSTSFLGALGFGTDTMEISASSLFGSAVAAFQDDDVLLGRLTFTALSAGSSTLSFLNHPVFGIQADVKGSDPANPLSFATIGSLGISVAAAVTVPEPGTVALLAAGLLLLSLRRRRRGAR